MADDYAAATSRTYYGPANSNQLARVWSVDKWVQDAVAAGFLNVFEGAGSDPTALSGYSTNKLWMRVPATGVTTAAAEVRKWNGSSPASSLANWPIASDLITSLIFGGTVGWAQTTFEAAASVTPINTAYYPGDVRRYGADPTGSVAADTAWTNACKTGHVVLGGGPGCVYKISTSILLTTSAVIDGQNCVIKPYTSAIGFARSMPAAAATPTISSGATQGSRALVVSSTTGLVVGQWARVKDTHEVHPPGWARITAIDTGTNTVSIDTALQHTYTALTGGSLSLEAFAAASFLSHLKLERVVLDGSESTSATVGEVVDVNGFLLVEIERCELRNWSDSTSSNAFPVAINYCIDVSITDNRSIDQDNGTGSPACMLVWTARTCTYSRNVHAGHGFGPEAVRCDHVVFDGNVLSGLRKQEGDAGYGASVRALKAAWCGKVVWSENHITGYESAFKSDDNFVATISNNIVAGAVGMADTGQILINTTYTAQSTITGNGAHTAPTRTMSEVVVSGNAVDGCPSTAIGISSAATSGTITVAASVTNNRIRKPGRYAIYVAHDGNPSRAIKPVIIGNDISDWGLVTSGAAIQHSDHGGVIVANQFRNDTSTALECVASFGVGYPWQVAKNLSHSGNPLKQEEASITLASASTVYIGNSPQMHVLVTGTTGITSFGGGFVGALRILRIQDGLTLTYGASTIITPSGANIVCAAGDVLVIVNETGAGGRWRVLQHVAAAPLIMAQPGGRLTLASATPVMTATATAQTTVYYSPFVHRFVPIYNGTSFALHDVGGELSQATTDSTKSPAAATTNSNYDVFVWLDGTTYRATRGPAWSSGTARGTGAGTTELERVNGIWVNKIAITNGPAARRGTYVGTIRTNGSSQVDFNLSGTAAAGGTAGDIGLWNAYNASPWAALVMDSTDSWSYTTATIRPSNNSTTMRVSFVVGLAQSTIRGIFSGASQTTSSTGRVGVGYDSTTAFSGHAGVMGSSTGFVFPGIGYYERPAEIGYHYVQALERGQTGVTFYGDNGQPDNFQTGLTVSGWF